MLFATKIHWFNCNPIFKTFLASPDLEAEHLEAKKISGLGWMLTRSHLNQIGTEEFFA